MMKGLLSVDEALAALLAGARPLSAAAVLATPAAHALGPGGAPRPPSTARVPLDFPCQPIAAGATNIHASVSCVADRGAAGFRRRRRAFLPELAAAPFVQDEAQMLTDPARFAALANALPPFLDALAAAR